MVTGNFELEEVDGKDFVLRGRLNLSPSLQEEEKIRFIKLGVFGTKKVTTKRPFRAAKSNSYHIGTYKFDLHEQMDTKSLGGYFTWMPLNSEYTLDFSVQLPEVEPSNDVENIKISYAAGVEAESLTKTRSVTPVGIGDIQPVIVRPDSTQQRTRSATFYHNFSSQYCTVNVNNPIVRAGESLELSLGSTKAHGLDLTLESLVQTQGMPPNIITIDKAFEIVGSGSNVKLDVPQNTPKSHVAKDYTIYTILRIEDTDTKKFKQIPIQVV